MPSDPTTRWGLVLTAPQGRDPGPGPHGALLERTLDRVRRIVPPERTLVIAARSTQRCLGPVLRRLPAECVVLQPADRGSTPAILYGLLRLATMDLAGPVGIFAEDRHVADDDAFTMHIDEAFAVIRARPDLVVLLGVASNGDDDAMWIEPGDSIPGTWGGDLLRVRRIWDRPPSAMVTALEAQGALRSAPVIVGYPFALTTLVKRTLPVVAEDFLRVQPGITTPWQGDSVRRLYSRLPSIDFCRRVLAARPANLAVLVPAGAVVRSGGEVTTEAVSA